MKMLIDQKLLNWKTGQRRKPLILHGARQVGKTYSLAPGGGTHRVSAMTRRYIYVSPRGDLQPCCFVPLAFRNIRNEPLKNLLDRLWNSHVMSYDCNQCLMNNPEFRKRLLPAIQAAKTLPVIFK